MTVTEIDYFLYSRHLHLHDHQILPGVSTHGMLVTDVAGLRGVPLSPVLKRYRHRAVSPEQRADLCSLLTLYWWWLRVEGCHLDTSKICTGKEERRCILVLLGGFSSPGQANPMVYLPYPFQIIFFCSRHLTEPKAIRPMVCMGT